MMKLIFASSDVNMMNNQSALPHELSSFVRNFSPAQTAAFILLMFAVWYLDAALAGGQIIPPVTQSPGDTAALGQNHLSLSPPGTFGQTITPAECAPTAAEEKEIETAFELLPDDKSPHVVLDQLIANRREEEAVSAQETSDQLARSREILPAQFKSKLLTDEQIAAHALYRRSREIAGRMFDRHQVNNRALLIYQSETPLLATWKTHFVLASTKAVELLSEAEFAGQVAHELGHLYFLDDLKTALEDDDYRAARIVELKCDLAAMMTLSLSKINSPAVASGLAVMTGWLAAHNQIKFVPTHPSLCARQEFAKRFAGKSKSDFAADSQPAARIPSLKERGALYFQAQIRYGSNDEEITFVPHARFMLLDQSLVTILKENNFSLDREQSSAEAKNKGAKNKVRQQRVEKNKRQKNKRAKNTREINNRLKEISHNDEISALKHVQLARATAEDDYLEAAVNVFKWRISEPEDGSKILADDSALINLLFEEAVKTHLIAAGETNQWGMNLFSPIKPGSYYLFGFAQTGRETLVWHLLLEIKTGNNQVELDQYNTELILDN